MWAANICSWGWPDSPSALPAEFESLVQASPVYELFGKEGLESWDMPYAEVPLHKGSIGFHKHSGEHDMEDYDWHRYIDRKSVV